MMSSQVKVLSMVEATLPPGFRFHPKDEELICDYLSNKQNSNSHHLPLLLQVDLNHCEPWDLPEAACVGGKEWYFYSQLDRKYATGLRTNRATVSGYWKATGKDRCIFDNRSQAQQLVGMRKTLVFYVGRAPKGKKTDWVMHEFRLHHHHYSSLKEDWVLCRVFCKNRELVGGIGKQNISVEDTVVSCSSSLLPPLMDPANYITDFQSQPTTNIIIFNQQQQQQQVPCFSNTTTIPLPAAAPPPIPIPSSKSIISQLSFGYDQYSSLCCDQKKDDEVFKAILSRFNDHHHDEDKNKSLSFGEQGAISDQSFLSDAALPVTMWYP